MNAFVLNDDLRSFLIVIGQMITKFEGAELPRGNLNLGVTTEAAVKGKPER